MVGTRRGPRVFLYGRPTTGRTSFKNVPLEDYTSHANPKSQKRIDQIWWAWLSILFEHREVSCCSVGGHIDMGEPLRNPAWDRQRRSNYSATAIAQLVTTFPGRHRGPKKFEEIDHQKPVERKISELPSIEGAIIKPFVPRPGIPPSPLKLAPGLRGVLTTRNG